MEEIGIIVVCAVVGYITSRASIILKHRLRGSLDEVLPQVLIVGLFTMYCGYGCIPLVVTFISWLGHLYSFSNFDFGFRDKGLLAPLSWRDIDAVFASLGLGYSLALIHNVFSVIRYGIEFKRLWPIREVWRDYEQSVLVEIISEDGDDFQRLQLESFEDDVPLLVTLSNGRLYYGLVAFENRHPKLLAEHREFRQLQIVPIFSGFRDIRRKMIHLTHVHPLLGGTPQDAKSSTVDVPFSKIVSMQVVELDHLFTGSAMSPSFRSAVNALPDLEAEHNPAEL